MKKAEELKKTILKNHIAWLEGISENIEDYPNTLDIADSANQADFKDCMFLDTPFEFIDTDIVNGENANFDAFFDINGFSFSIYKNEDVIGTEAWFLELEDEYNFNISWQEFDEQMNKYK